MWNIRSYIPTKQMAAKGMITDLTTTKGIVFDIKNYALHDGPGIRTTVFLKGCPLRCWWCHNPESQQLRPETYQRICRLAYHTFRRTETVGRRMSVSEVLDVLERERLFHDQSGGGVTFSGGEPLLQINFLEALLEMTKERDFHTCLDTAGFTTPEKFRRILPFTDLFLYDLKLLDEDRHRTYTGVSNKHILGNLDTLMQAGKEVIIRFPVIPSITDTEDNLQRLMKWLEKNGSAVQQLDLLPYHRTGRGKYQRFGVENKMANIEEPRPAHLQKIQSLLTEAGVRITVSA